MTNNEQKSGENAGNSNNQKQQDAGKTGQTGQGQNEGGKTSSGSR